MVLCGLGVCVCFVYVSEGGLIMFEILILIMDFIVCLLILFFLVCLVGLFFECVGIVDIGLEGKMLGVVFGVGVVVFVIGSVWIGFLVGIIVLVVLVLIYGFVLIIYCGN